MTQAATPTALQGRRVLLAEDEFIAAEDCVDLLSEAGAEVLGPAASVADALEIALADGRIDAALLDVNLEGEAIWPVMDELLVRGVPVVLTTGCDVTTIPSAYVGLPRCEKPASRRNITTRSRRASTTGMPPARPPIRTP